MESTLLADDPLMCAVVMADKNHIIKVETGIDVFAKQLDDKDDENYFGKKSGKGENSLVDLPVF